jgi:hypothetical protein
VYKFCPTIFKGQAPLLNEVVFNQIYSTALVESPPVATLTFVIFAGVFPAQMVSLA